MKFDFSVPMTGYEFIALIMAGAAIILPPISKFIWNKWIVKEKLNFHSTGKIALLFNQSGSYLRVDGVYEAEKKPICIKKISVKVSKEKSENKLNLEWLSFRSPINQSIVGAYVHSTEEAHPFRVEADSVACAFTEFGERSGSFSKTFANATKDLFAKIQGITVLEKNYDEAVVRFKKLPEYVHAVAILEREFFWDIGKYDIDIAVQYAKKTVHFNLKFVVDEAEQLRLMNNIDEDLLAPLKSAYNVGWNFYTAYVDAHY